MKRNQKFPKPITTRYMSPERLLESFLELNTKDGLPFDIRADDIFQKNVSLCTLIFTLSANLEGRKQYIESVKSHWEVSGHLDCCSTLIKYFALYLFENEEELVKAKEQVDKIKDKYVLPNVV